MKLDRVTITGADDGTVIDDLLRMTERYPFVEWGILLSRGQCGGPRFPSWRWIRQLHEACAAGAKMRLAGHVCGAYLRDMCVGGTLLRDDLPFLPGFDRIQLNFHGEKHEISTGLFLSLLRHAYGKFQWIFQADDVNDAILAHAIEDGLDAVPLFDLSHGAGVLPAEWPAPVADYCGYAGGLSPDNLAEQLPKIAEAADGGRIWIDVETHVRTREVLDMQKVERFLDIVAPVVVTA